MRIFKLNIAMLCALLLFTGCGSMSNTTKGGLIGAGSGAAIGALAGRLIGNSGKGTAIGAVIGTAVGTTAGVLIGKKMDKAKAEAEAIANAQVESVTDANGLQAVKVTFDSGIFFDTNKADLKASAKESLREFAGVLNNYADADVSIIGHTDSTGSDEINNPLSLRRAQSVESYLRSCGVTVGQIASVEGKGSTEPVADNSTSIGRSQNRRVEIYMYASPEMVKAANAGTLK